MGALALMLVSCATAKTEMVARSCGLRLTTEPIVIKRSLHIEGDRNGTRLVELPNISGITLSLGNESDRSVRAMLPFEFTAGGGVAGVEYEILDAGGRHLPLCSHIDIDSAPRPTLVRPNVIVSSQESISSLKTAYCFGWGFFSLTAIFHNITGEGECNGLIRSNTIKFEIPP
jgi:hypothetical protein